MATLRALSRKAINVGPTVSQLPSGVPHAVGLNLAATAPADAHGAHAHGGAGAHRADVVPSWAGSSRSKSGSLLSKTYLNGAEHFAGALPDVPEY